MYTILRRPKKRDSKGRPISKWEAVRDYKSHDDAADDCSRYRAKTKVYHYLVADERFCPWMPARMEAIG